MESQIIERIGRSALEKALPKIKSVYPFTQVKGRVISTRVVGVTFEGRQEVVAKLQMGDRIWLEMEPDNPCDHNAIKVCRSNGEQVGYINRKLAEDISPYFRAYGYPVHGKVSLLTGSHWDGYSLGVIVVFKLPKLKRSSNSHCPPTFDQWDEWGD